MVGICYLNQRYRKPHRARRLKYVKRGFQGDDAIGFLMGAKTRKDNRTMSPSFLPDNSNSSIPAFKVQHNYIITDSFTYLTIH